MSRTNAPEVRRAQHNGAIVLTNRVAPNRGDTDGGGPQYPQPVIDDFIENGIFGLVDYETGRSANPEDVPQQESNTGKGALNNYAEFTEVGGYLLAHDEFGRVYLAHATPGCGMFTTTLVNGEETELKCIKVDAYAEIDHDDWTGLIDILEDRSYRHTLAGVTDSNERERIVSAYTALERSGDLIYP
ncbi:hypothetical protein [Halovenus sp. HT40]|uniref:hypothetical protein n=1 Tax=Halovenus sp. HT40 TaxID=3126691 RepID=UPI00300F2315